MPPPEFLLPAPDPWTSASSPPEPAPDTPSAWSNVYFDAGKVDKLVDRLTWALSEKTQLVRELEAARAALAAQQQQLVDARDKAERARTTLATFLHALGHDLRAPLVSLDAGLQLMEMESTARMGEAQRLGTEQAIQVAAQDMRRTCGHGLALIHDLFELIRSDAGAWRVELAQVTLGELLSNATAVIAAQAQAKGLTIDLVWAERGNSAGALAATTISTDATRVAQALVNLLGNAVKFSSHGTITIGVALQSNAALATEVHEVEVHEATAQPCVLELTVDDAGPGIEAALLPRIFEPFTQGDAGLRSKGGVGLGLAIVERCARLLGGHARVANRAEGGARFTLEIPVTRTVLRDTETAVSDGRSSAHTQSHTQSHNQSHNQSHTQSLADPTEGITAETLRVLLVDDALDAGRLLAHHLRHAGASVTCAASLREARQTLKSNLGTNLAFDMVITDLELGDGSGLDLANELALGPHHTNHHAPVAPIVVLSSARPASEVSRIWQGFFLPKPISRASIDALLRPLKERLRRC